MEKIRLIFAVIFTIGAISLAAYILTKNYVSPSCNPDDYSFGSREWQDCLSARSEASKSKYNTLDDCRDLNYFSKVSCYKEIAIKNNDISICDEFKDIVIANGQSPEDYISCYVRVGQENANLAACDKAAEFKDEYSLLDSDDCYKWIAHKTQDPTLCEKLTEYKESCIRLATCVAQGTCEV